MTLISGVIAAAGMAAAVLAVVQLARQQSRLRDELDELRAARVPEAGPGKRQADVRPIFGELYETKPSPFEVLGEWPGVPLAIAAAGLFAIGMFTNRVPPPSVNGVDSTIAHDIAAARLQYDSLAKEVAAMRDSMGKTTPNAVIAREAESRPPKGKTTLVRARPVAEAPTIAPLPAMPKVGP